jgi:ferrochelatase
MPFSAEPAYAHGAAPADGARTAVLYCNLGTPDAPTAPALRAYLAEFLSDQRVVEIPRPIWWLILHGIILRVRPKKSAAKYASIWTPEGSPLRVWTDKQSRLLAQSLADRGHRLQVRYAMRYGSPSIGSQLDEFKKLGVERVLIVPAYPQYSATTTASVFDAVYAWSQKARRLHELRFVNHYHDESGYIEALAHSVRAHWQAHGQAEQLVMSFHGVPAAEAGTRSVDVICPGFTADCLETLEEIQDEARQAFLMAGGERFQYIACLNDQSAWIEALADVCERHLAGWATLQAPDLQALARSRQEALALGAQR